MGPTSGSEVCRVLAEDPDLGEGMSEARREAAERDCVAAVVRRDTGRWHADEDSDLARGGIGLLVLEGLLVRGVGREQRRSLELLGPGELLRPWQHDGEDAMLPFATTWQVLEPLRVAVLDLRFAVRIAPYPEIASNLVGRALQRARVLATTLAIVHNVRVERRVHMLMWSLAERFGRVGKDGIVLKLDITHRLLADMIAVQRPSVTTALRVLAERGLVERIEGGWLLRGDPPSADDAAAAVGNEVGA